MRPGSAAGRVLVTGGAGFIGSHLVRHLNDRGVGEVIVVDSDVPSAAKWRNLDGCRVAEVWSRSELARRVEARTLPPLWGVLHHGAVTDTQGDEVSRLAEDDRTARALLALAGVAGVPFVYAGSASVYGPGHASGGVERPTTTYARSKLAFDRHARRLMPLIGTTIMGLRYFNVYGPNEWHKEKRASIVLQLYRQVNAGRPATLFARPGIAVPGSEQRDFVYVDDVVRVAVESLIGPVRQGIVDVGTGRPRSFNDVADVLFGMLGSGRVEYVPMGPELSRNYQTFTRADVTGLEQLGLPVPGTPLEEGIAHCLRRWSDSDRDLSQ